MDLSILTIAGFDTCGGAGIHADIKTIESLGFHPSSVVTAITFQNTCRISGLIAIPPDAVEKQISAILGDLNVVGIKIGMVCNMEIARSVVKSIEKIDVPKVLDPVINASVGFELGSADVYSTVAKACSVITPNVEEAMQFAGMKIDCVEDAIKAARKIADDFGCSVVITGGELGGRDVVYDMQQGDHFIVKGELVKAEVHGTGCVYSSALACYLAKGYSLSDSCELARKFVLSAVKKAKKVGKCLPVVSPYCSSGSSGISIARSR